MAASSYYHPIPSNLKELASELETLGGGDARVGHLEIIGVINPEPSHEVWSEGNTVAVKSQVTFNNHPAIKFKTSSILNKGRMAESLDSVTDWIHDGFNGTILTLGKGKTETLFNDSKPDEEAVVPHIISDLFEKMYPNSSTQKHYGSSMSFSANKKRERYVIGVSIWEVIGNKVIDMLHQILREGSSKDRKVNSAVETKVREGQFVTIQVHEKSEALELIHQANEYRFKNKTKSHSISAYSNLFIRLCILNETSDHLSTLHIIDSASPPSISPHSWFNSVDSKDPSSTSQNKVQKLSLYEDRVAASFSEIEIIRKQTSTSLFSLNKLIAELGKEEKRNSLSRNSSNKEETKQVQNQNQNPPSPLLSTTDDGHNQLVLLSARNSLLTSMIAPLLGGNGKTWLLCCIESDDVENAEFTLRTALKGKSLAAACSRIRGVKRDELELTPYPKLPLRKERNSKDDEKVALPFSSHVKEKLDESSSIEKGNFQLLFSENPLYPNGIDHEKGKDKKHYQIKENDDDFDNQNRSDRLGLHESERVDQQDKSRANLSLLDLAEEVEKENSLNHLKRNDENIFNESRPRTNMSYDDSNNDFNNGNLFSQLENTPSDQKVFSFKSRRESGDVRVYGVSTSSGVSGGDGGGVSGASAKSSADFKRLASSTWPWPSSPQKKTAAMEMETSRKEYGVIYEHDGDDGGVKGGGGGGGGGVVAEVLVENHEEEEDEPIWPVSPTTDANAGAILASKRDGHPPPPNPLDDSSTSLQFSKHNRNEISASTRVMPPSSPSSFRGQSSQLFTSGVVSGEELALLDGDDDHDDDDGMRDRDEEEEEKDQRINLQSLKKKLELEKNENISLRQQLDDFEYEHQVEKVELESKLVSLQQINLNLEGKLRHHLKKEKDYVASMVSNQKGENSAKSMVEDSYHGTSSKEKQSGVSGENVSNIVSLLEQKLSFFQDRVRDLEDQNISLESENKHFRAKLRKYVQHDRSPQSLERKINNLSAGKSSTSSSTPSTSTIMNPFASKKVMGNKHHPNQKQQSSNQHHPSTKNQDYNDNNNNEHLELIEALHKKLKFKERMLVKLDSNLNGKIDELTYEVEELRKGKKAMEASRRIVEKQSKKINDLGNSVKYLEAELNDSIVACERMSTNYAQALGKKLLAEEKAKELKAELKQRLEEIAMLHHNYTSATTKEQRSRLAKDYASPTRRQPPSRGGGGNMTASPSRPQQQQQAHATRVSSRSAKALTILANYDEQIIQKMEEENKNKGPVKDNFGVEFLKCLEQLTSCVRRNQPTLLSVLRKLKLLVKDTLDTKMQREKLLVDVITALLDDLGLSESKRSSEYRASVEEKCGLNELQDDDDDDDGRYDVRGDADHMDQLNDSKQCKPERRPPPPPLPASNQYHQSSAKDTTSLQEDKWIANHHLGRSLEA